jgi:hypothetical protein
LREQIAHTVANPGEIRLIRAIPDSPRFNDLTIQRFNAFFLFLSA